MVLQQLQTSKWFQYTRYLKSNFVYHLLHQLKQRLHGKTKAILICNPCNPTGYLYTQEEIEALGELALKHNIFLIVDEVYREFIHDDVTEFYSVLQSERLKEHAIMIDSVSKRYSLCGARDRMYRF